MYIEAVDTQWIGIKQGIWTNCARVRGGSFFLRLCTEITGLILAKYMVRLNATRKLLAECMDVDGGVMRRVGSCTKTLAKCFINLHS